MTRTDYAWAAGVLDGEGCFSAQGTYPTLSVGQSGNSTTPEMLLRLEKLFGGTINGPYKTNGKPKWTWGVRGFELVQNVLASTWSWLGPDKREQARRNLSRSIK